MGKQATTSEGKKWAEKDDEFLALLLQRHIPFPQIAKILGRTKNAVVHRSHTTLREIYEASGHPSFQPAKGEALRKAAAERKAARIHIVPDEPPTIDDLVRQVAGLTARISKLETELGVQS